MTLIIQLCRDIWTLPNVSTPEDPSRIYHLMFRNVTDAQILNRAVCLQKSAVVISLLKKLPSDMKVRKLIKVLRGWTTPEILLNQAIQEFSNVLKIVAQKNTRSPS